MYYHCFILLISIIASSTASIDGTCVNPTDLSFIQNLLTNISDQLKKPSSFSDGMSDSITSVTSLLQLSMLKELMTIGKDSSSDKNSSSNEGLIMLRRLERILNMTTTDIALHLNTSTSDITVKIDTLATLTTNVAAKLNASAKDIITKLDTSSESIITMINTSFVSKLDSSNEDIKTKLNESNSNIASKLDISIALTNDTTAALDASTRNIASKLTTSTASITTKLDAFISEMRNTLSGIETRLALLEGVIHNVPTDLQRIAQLLYKHINSNDSVEEVPSVSPFLSSCDEILKKWPDSESGYYTIIDVNGQVRHVYCHMESMCNIKGGWMKVAYLNMTHTSEKCPAVFKLYSNGDVRACGRPYSGHGNCVGLKFPSKNIKYSQVCGKVIGYQVGYPDGSRHRGSNINNRYADGISLTHGNPRKHIWTFICGTSDRGSAGNHCPCGSRYPEGVSSFVGADYYCEAGYQGSTSPNGGIFYSNDRLWDGKDCGHYETACCRRTLQPWFHKSLAHYTSDSIEMRICLDEGTNDEDVAVEQYVIYVK